MPSFPGYATRKSEFPATSLPARIYGAPIRTEGIAAPLLGSHDFGPDCQPKGCRAESYPGSQISPTSSSSALSVNSPKPRFGGNGQYRGNWALLKRAAVAAKGRNRLLAVRRRPVSQSLRVGLPCWLTVRPHGADRQWKEDPPV